MPEIQPCDELVKRIQELEHEATESKRTIRELCEVEKRYGSFVAHFRGITFQSTLDFTPVFFHGAVEAITGYTEEEFVAGTPTWAQIIHPDDLAEVAGEAEIRSIPDFCCERDYRIIHKDNQIRWVHEVIYTVCNNSGEPAFFEGTIYDITDSILVKKELQETKEFFDKIIDSIFDAILIIDLDYRIVEVNSSFLQQYNQPREQIIGRKCYEISHQRNSPCHEFHPCPLKSSVATKSPTTMEHIHKDQAGNDLIVEVTSFPLFGADGEIEHIVEVIHDITDRIQAEESLRQAQKMEAIGTLAGGIAHDFNNILMAIIGHVDLSRLGLPEGDPVRAHLDEVKKAGERAKELVQQILTFSRRTEQNSRPVQMHLIVKEALKLLRATIPTTIEIRQCIDSGCGAIMADPTQIYQVLMNLCTNSFQAMREHGGILEVTLETVEVGIDRASTVQGLHEGRYNLLKVKDTGLGIDQMTMRRIFEPYFTTKTTGEGTGLGLAMVHGIVTSNGGAITVASKPGIGSTFSVYLPCVETLSIKTISEPKYAPVGTEHIMFIDDEELLVQLCRDMLEKIGYKVVAHTSSVEALTAFRTQPNEVDLVITDQTMPHITGIKLAREMMHIRPNLPVILITGFSEAVTTEYVKQIGIRELIMKPFDALSLGEVVRRVLDNN